ncbi:hypothetical protein V5H98_16030 [Georgenia sp. M64]|uniref:hypothetical protein n=1 Tax=Georgenia sp. M64 TaxID=3120520 RepID=UPI0030E4DF05
METLLEDAQIKLSSVISDIFGVSGRKRMAALVAGECDPEMLADLAWGRMCKKSAKLRQAFEGRFNDHHAFLLRTMLGRIDAINADIAAMEAQLGEQLVPFARAVQHIDEIPGSPARRRRG